MIYAYARCSTNETKQSTERQIEAFRRWEKDNHTLIDVLIEEYATGKNFDREKYKKMKERIQKDDILIVKELDRFGRSMDLIKDEWNYFMLKGVKIIVIDMPLISSDVKGEKNLDMRFIANLVFEVLCYSAEKEREKLSQRTKEALAVKKQQGIKLGRPNIYDEDTIRKVLYEYQLGTKLSDIKAKYGVSADRVRIWRNQYGVEGRNKKRDT